MSLGQILEADVAEFIDPKYEEEAEFQESHSNWFGSSFLYCYHKAGEKSHSNPTITPLTRMANITFQLVGDHKGKTTEER